MSYFSASAREGEWLFSRQENCRKEVPAWRTPQRALSLPTEVTFARAQWVVPLVSSHVWSVFATIKVVQVNPQARGSNGKSTRPPMKHVQVSEVRGESKSTKMTLMADTRNSWKVFATRTVSLLDSATSLCACPMPDARHVCQVAWVPHVPLVPLVPSSVQCALTTKLNFSRAWCVVPSAFPACLVPGVCPGVFRALKRTGALPGAAPCWRPSRKKSTTLPAPGNT